MLSFIDPFAIRVQVNDALRGSNKAVKRGNVVEVSPAMWDLIRNEPGEKLEELLKQIPILDLDAVERAERMRQVSFNNWAKWNL